jgi:hypothetical protein
LSLRNLATTLFLHRHEKDCLEEMDGVADAPASPRRETAT